MFAPFFVIDVASRTLKTIGWEPEFPWISNMSENFAELFEESFASQQIKPGAIITGTIVAINDDVVIVSAGLKSEAVIPKEQFKNDKGEEGGIAVGDTVEVALDAVEDGFGETKLSREKAIRARTWIDLEKAFEEGAVVEGVINGRVKGGFTVEIDQVRAFLPGSLVDVRPVRDPAYLEGKELEFKVIKLDQRRNNVVVSRRAVVEKEYSAEREALLKELQEGSMAKGIVKNLTDYGAFVDLGAHHRHGLEARKTSFRGGRSGPGNRRQDLEIRPRTSACIARHEAARRRSVAGSRSTLSATNAHVR